MEKKIIIFMCIFFIHNTHNLSSMDSNVNINTDAFLNYKMICEQINKKQEEKFFNFTNMITMENRSSLLDSITTKFTNLKNTIETKEQNILLKIKEDFKINNDLWASILTINQMIQNCEEFCQNLPIPNIIHDENISSAALYIFKKYLIKNEINPDRINIKQSNFNKWIIESPIPTWSIVNNTVIFDNSFTLPGIIEMPFYICTSINDLKAFSIIYSYAIKNKKTIFRNILNKYVYNFNITIEEFMTNKQLKEYNSNILRFAHIKAAFINQKYANLLHTLNNKTFIVDDTIFTTTEMHTILSKIKRYWDSIKWLQKYNPTKTQLTIKKDPTKEQVTLKELNVWKKNNNFPVCLPIRNGHFDSHNTFDILKNHSFVKIFTGKQDKLAYDFFIVLAKNNPIYEHINTHNDNFQLKILSSNEYNFNTLIVKYGENIIKNAIDMANQYARRKGKNLVAIEQGI